MMTVGYYDGNKNGITSSAPLILGITEQLWLGYAYYVNRAGCGLW